MSSKKQTTKRTHEVMMLEGVHFNKVPFETPIMLDGSPCELLVSYQTNVRFGEVAKAFSVNTSLIRFWEKEFEIIKPKKNAKGNRLFTPEDISNFKLIYNLVIAFPIWHEAPILS